MTKLRLALFVPCLFAAGMALAGPTAWVARVEESAISRADADYWLKVEQVYGNPSASEEAAVVALVNDAVEREVARRAGVAATPEEIAELEKYSDATSKAPELLRQVKAIFGEDRAGYGRLYIEPRITNRKLRHYYSTAPELHGVERTQIEKVRALVQAGRSLKQAARATGLKAVASTVEDKPIELPSAMKPYRQGEASPKDPLVALLEKLPAGKVYPGIIEDEGGYRIVRLAGKGKQRYRIETVHVAKLPFEAWFAARRAQLRIAMADPALAENIRTRYPQWAGNNSSGF